MERFQLNLKSFLDGNDAGAYAGVDLVKLLWQVCEGLEHLHSNTTMPVVHGQLKCSNILLKRLRSGSLVAYLSNYGIKVPLRMDAPVSFNLFTI